MTRHVDHGRQADANEIEITPEMIEAGYQVLPASGLTDDPLEADRLVIAEIFRAMFSLYRRPESCLT